MIRMKRIILQLAVASVVLFDSLATFAVNPIRPIKAVNPVILPDNGAHSGKTAATYMPSVVIIDYSPHRALIAKGQSSEGPLRPPSGRAGTT